MGGWGGAHFGCHGKTLRLIPYWSVASCLFLAVSSAKESTSSNSCAESRSFQSLPSGELTKIKGWPAFRAALAKLSQDGEPMTKVADGTDEGGVNGPAAANAAAQARHDARVNRLCELIRANIYPNTGIYREITKDVWNGLGVHVYNYVVEQMNKPLNSKHRTLLNSFFNAATVESLHVPINGSLATTFLALIEEIASWFPAGDPNQPNNAKKLMMFLDGMPPAMYTLVSLQASRPDPAFVIAPVYAPPHPLQGQAHPLAGEVNLEKLAVYMDSEANELLKKGQMRETKIKPLKISIEMAIGEQIEGKSINALGGNFKRGTDSRDRSTPRMASGTRLWRGSATRDAFGAGIHGGAAGMQECARRFSRLRERREARVSVGDTRKTPHPTGIH